MTTYEQSCCDLEEGIPNTQVVNVDADTRKWAGGAPIQGILHPLSACRRQLPSVVVRMWLWRCIRIKIAVATTSHASI